jgi:hypothetical protein
MSDDLPAELHITLRRQVIDVVDGVETPVTELHLREPTGGEMRQADAKGDSVAVTITALALVAGVSEKAVRQLVARDLDRAGSYCARFVVAPVADWPDPDRQPDTFDVPIGKEVATPTGPISHLKLREPDAGQIEQYEPRLGWDRKIGMLATVSALPESVIESLPVRVINEGVAYLDGFFAGGPRAGGTS